MSQARLLLLCMQRRFSSLRFYPTCDCEKADDVVESTGGILSPWRLSAGVVVRYLAHLFGLSQDDVLEAVEAMGTLARACKTFYVQICQSELIEDDRAPKAFATILEKVVPANPLCTGKFCPVCESLAALRESLPVPLATGPSASSSATGPASSSVAPATGLAAPPATGPSALSSAVNSSCKDLAWEASCPSGVTGRGKKPWEKESSARRRQTTDDRRRQTTPCGVWECCF